jgi:hypothetical protein
MEEVTWQEFSKQTNQPLQERSFPQEYACVWLRIIQN